MKLLKGFGIFILFCALFDLGFIGAMQEAQTGKTTINDGFEFVFSLLIIIGIVMLIKKFIPKKDKYRYINGKRHETVQEMYSRTYNENGYVGVGHKTLVSDISCVYCGNPFNGKEATHYNVASDTVICPHCGKKMGIKQTVQYTCYEISQ
jgi:hypothetical protein